MVDWTVYPQLEAAPKKALIDQRNRARWCSAETKSKKYSHSAILFDESSIALGSMRERKSSKSNSASVIGLRPLNYFFGARTFCSRIPFIGKRVGERFLTTVARWPVRPGRQVRRPLQPAHRWARSRRDQTKFDSHEHQDRQDNRQNRGITNLFAGSQARRIAYPGLTVNGNYAQMLAATC